MSIFDGHRLLLTMKIRPATPDDLPAIMDVMDAARSIMRASGNLHQWADGYPPKERIVADIACGGGYVIEADDARLAGYFAFLPSPEPTYSAIYDGSWLVDTAPYHVIHRIASRPDVHGIFAAMLDYCSSLEPNIRIDTHRDNLIMQHLLAKHGFSYCGIIYLASGDERLAYQRIIRG